MSATKAHRKTCWFQLAHTQKLLVFCCVLWWRRLIWCLQLIRFHLQDLHSNTMNWLMKAEDDRPKHTCCCVKSLVSIWDLVQENQQLPSFTVSQSFLSVFLYLSPSVSWWVTHWWSRRGSQSAERKCLDEADSRTEGSRPRWEVPQPAEPHQGPAVRCCWKFWNIHPWSPGGLRTFWMGCSPGVQVGSGTGTKERKYIFEY